MDLFGQNTMAIAATAVFAIAVAHTFSTKIFARLARTQTRHAGLWHLLAEVEVVFGFWSFVLMAHLVNGFCCRLKRSHHAYVQTTEFRSSPMSRIWWHRKKTVIPR